MFLFALLGVDAGVWTMFLTRIVEEMSPAYLVFVGLIFVAVKLGYKYLSKKLILPWTRKSHFWSCFKRLYMLSPNWMKLSTNCMGKLMLSGATMKNYWNYSDNKT